MEENVSRQDINLIKQVTTLVADVRNIKEGQDKFHLEMKDSFKRLEDNYAGRLNIIETRLNALETSKTRQNVAMSVGIIILTTLTSLLTYHILK
jgi:hypothetical protein